MIRKSFSFVLSFVCATSILASSAFASSNDAVLDKESISIAQKTEILKTMNEISLLDLANIASKKTSEWNSTYEKGTENASKADLERKLASLGVRKMSVTESQSFIRSKMDSSVSPQIALPPNTNNVDLYQFNYTHTRNGKSYDIQEVYVHGNNIGSNLYKGSDALYLFNNSVNVTNYSSAVVLTYAEKIAGSLVSKVPGLNYFPWELFLNLPSSTTTIAWNSESVFYRALETVCFSWVKEAGKPDSYQTLSYISSMYDISSHLNSGRIDNYGTPQAKPYTSATSEVIESKYADNYASGSKAVDYFLNLGKGSSYASAYIWSAKDGKYTAKVSFEMPTLLGQVYY